MSAASIACRCVIVWRRSRAPFASRAAWKLSSASRVARSPIACTWICQPALSSAMKPGFASRQAGSGPRAVPGLQSGCSRVPALTR